MKDKDSIIPEHWTSCEITPPIGGLLETFLVRLKGKGVNFVTTANNTTLRIVDAETGREPANDFLRQITSGAIKERFPNISVIFY